MDVAIRREVFPLVWSDKEKTLERQKVMSGAYEVRGALVPNLFVVDSRSEETVSHLVALIPVLGGVLGSCDCYGFLSANRTREGRTDKRVACVHLVAVASRLGLAIPKH